MKITKRKIIRTKPTPLAQLSSVFRQIKTSSFKKGLRLETTFTRKIDTSHSLTVRMVELEKREQPTLHELNSWIFAKGLLPATAEVLIACEGHIQYIPMECFVAPGTTVIWENHQQLLIHGWDDGISVDHRVFSFIDLNTHFFDPGSKKGGCKWVTEKKPTTLNRHHLSFPTREAYGGNIYYLCCEQD